MTSNELDTFSAPLHKLSTGKYILPILWAPYWQATVAHFADATRDHGQVTVRFMDGGGMSFQETIRRAQEQWDVDRRHEECLRTYNLPPN